jgi:hypothetical protein
VRAPLDDQIAIGYPRDSGIIAANLALSSVALESVRTSTESKKDGKKILIPTVTSGRVMK